MINLPTADIIMPFARSVSAFELESKSQWKNLFLLWWLSNFTFRPLMRRCLNCNSLSNVHDILTIPQVTHSLLLYLSHLYDGVCPFGVCVHWMVLRIKWSILWKENDRAKAQNPFEWQFHVIKGLKFSCSLSFKGLLVPSWVNSTNVGLKICFVLLYLFHRFKLLSLEVYFT